METESGYEEMNAWLEWIKYSVRTLNKNDGYTCVVGKSEDGVVLSHVDGPQIPKDGMHGLPLPGWDGLEVSILLIPVLSVSSHQGTEEKALSFELCVLL